jgi:hypothetical protein
MRKVNLDKELDQLYEKRIYAYKTRYTDGVIIKKDDMSKYIKRCFDQSVILECVINGRLNYRYYVDEKNNTCILFTDSFIEDENDKNEIAIKADTIVVEIYLSEQEFEDGELANFYHQLFVMPSTDNYGIKNGYYYTDCKEYNNQPLVKAISRISDRPDKMRMKIIDDIING